MTKDPGWIWLYMVKEEGPQRKDGWLEQGLGFVEGGLGGVVGGWLKGVSIIRK